MPSPTHDQSSPTLPRRSGPAPAPDPSGWLPIETAPRDGTPVDLWVVPHDAFENGNAARICDAVCADSGLWMRPMNGLWGPVSACGEPTHWRPRPLEPGRSSPCTDTASGTGEPNGEWRPALTGAHMLSDPRAGDVLLNIPTALCWMQFTPGSMTGRDPDTRPGLGFKLAAYPGSSGEWPSGVISRTEAARLHAMLGAFLASNPPSQEP